MKTGIWVVLIALIVGAVALVVFRKEQSESPQTAANTQLTIAVIPKGTTHSYWNSVHAGADQAAKDLNVKIIFKGPILEDDRAGQISLVEEFASGDANGIVLAPLDDTALLPSVQSAMQKKTPVVIIDSSLKGDVGKDFVCYVGTDNTAAGKIGGTELARLLGGKGKYVLLRYAVGSASTQQREDGFLSAMAENPGHGPSRQGPLWRSHGRSSPGGVFESPGGDQAGGRDFLPQRIHYPGNAEHIGAEQSGREDTLRRLRYKPGTDRSAQKR